MRVIFIGMKGCGKTTLGWMLARKMGIPFLDSDAYIEKMHEQEKGEALPFREIFKKYGGAYFSALDTQALRYIAREFDKRDFVFSCGGSTPLVQENQEILAGLGSIVFLEVEKTVLLKRILAQGVPAFFRYQDDPARSLEELLAERVPVYKRLAHRTLDVSNGVSEEVVAALVTELEDDDKN